MRVLFTVVRSGASFVIRTGNHRSRVRERTLSTRTKLEQDRRGAVAAARYYEACGQRRSGPGFGPGGCPSYNPFMPLSERAERERDADKWPLDPVTGEQLVARRRPGGRAEEAHACRF